MVKKHTTIMMAALRVAGDVMNQEAPADSGSVAPSRIHTQHTQLFQAAAYIMDKKSAEPIDPSAGRLTHCYSPHCIISRRYDAP
jgi:hypothetical protein